MKKRRALSFLLFFLSMPVFPQENIDRLLRALPAERSLDRFIYLDSLSAAYLEMDPNRALLYAEEALALAQELNNKEGIANATNRIGNYYYTVADYHTALKLFLSALDIRQTIGDLNGIGKSYNNIALIYYAVGDIDRTIEYAEKSLEIREKYDNTSALALTSNNLSVFWLVKGDTGKAMGFAQRALELYKSAGDQEGMADAMNNLGDIYVGKGNYTKAIEYHMNALETYERLRNRFSIANSKLNIGQLFLKQKEMEKAYYWLTEAMQDATGLQAPELKGTIYQELSRYFERTGNYEKALAFREYYASVKDSILMPGDLKQISALQMAFESDFKEREILLLSQEKEVLNIRWEKQRNLRTFLIILAGILLIIVIVGSYWLRTKRNLNNLLKKKNTELFYTNKILNESKKKLEQINHTKDRFFSIVSNDLIQPFRALMQLAENIYNAGTGKTDHEILQLTKQLYLSSHDLYYLLENLLFWSRIQNGNIRPRPRTFVLFPVLMDSINALRIHAEEKNIRVVYNVPVDLKATGDQQFFSIVFRNLLQNAVRFTERNGRVNIDVGEAGKMIELIVSDTGIGISEEMLERLFLHENGMNVGQQSGKNESGLGLILCRILTEVNRGKIRASSLPGTGSTFVITIPVAR